MKQGAREIGRDEISSLYGKINTLEPRQILEVPAGAGGKEIREAYFKQVKRLHPDLFHCEGDGDLMRQVNTIFQKVNEAYTILKKGPTEQPPIRTGWEDCDVEYNQSAAEARRERKAAAERLYRRARRFLDGGRIREAVESFQSAIRLNDANPNYHSWLGEALARTGKMLHRAEESCLQAIAMNGGEALFHVHLAHVYQRGHLARKAKEEFRAALAIDPHCAEARAEMGASSKFAYSARGFGRIFSKVA